MNKHYYITIFCLVTIVMVEARFQIHEQVVQHASTVSAADEANTVVQDQSVSAKVQLQQSQEAGKTVQKADIQLVSSENEICTDAASCTGAQTALLQTGPVTEEAVQFKNYKSYIALWQRINDGTWKQIGYIANKVIPVNQLEDHGFLDITMQPDGKAGIVRGGHTIILDFTKSIK